jgi:hypothetical protein
MKKIVYSHGGRACICHPAEGARLIRTLTLSDGTVLGDKESPVHADTLLRTWPIDGAIADWAETESEFLDRIKSKDVPEGATDVLIIDSSEIPADRKFRDAWRISEGRIEHEMSACVEIHRANIRIEREPLLTELDIRYMRAVEAGDSAAQKQIAQEKQILRDATDDPRIAAAKTPEELSLAIPEALIALPAA